MRLYTLSVLFVLWVLCCDLQAQQECIFPFHQDSLYGYTNSRGETIIPAIFEEAFETLGTISPVRYHNKWGFIENSGAFYIKPEYDTLVDFGYGYWELRKNHIHKQVSRFKYLYGNQIVTYSSCGYHKDHIYSPSRSGFIVEKNGFYGVIYDHYLLEEKKSIPDTLGLFDSLVIITNQLFGVMRNGKFAILNQAFIKLDPEVELAKLDFTYDEFQFFPCPRCMGEPGMHHDIIGYKVNGLWGYIWIHITSYIVTPPLYYSISSLAANGIGLVEFKPGRFGYIDTKGKEYFDRDP